MGFGLMFVRMTEFELIDADRVALAEFLASEGLTAGSNEGIVRISTGEPLTFDGRWTDLRLDPLTQEDPVSGKIDHAFLTDDEVSFIYGLCKAGKMMVVNPQGSPMYIVPAGTHDQESVPDPDDTTWVNTPEELARALSPSFGDFEGFRDRTIGTSESKLP